MEVVKRPESLTFMRPGSLVDPLLKCLDGQLWALHPGTDYRDLNRTRSRLHHLSKLRGHKVSTRLDNLILYVQAYQAVPGDYWMNHTIDLTSPGADAPQAP